MTKSNRIGALALVCMSLMGGAGLYADTIGWNFTDLNGTFDTGVANNFQVGDFSIGNSFGNVATPINSQSVSSGYSGASGGGNIGNAVNLGGLNTSSSAYFQVTLTPDSGYGLSVTDMDFGARSTGTGPMAYSLRSSVDGYATDLATGTIANNSVWSFKNNTIIPASDGAITLRLFMYNASGNPQSGTINSKLDDISIIAEATPLPVPLPLAAIGGVALLPLALVSGIRRRRRGE